MLSRAKRWKSLTLSPGVSVIFAILGAILIFFRSNEAIYLLPFDIAIGALLVYEIKARGLFKGPNFPVLAVFMLLQAVSGYSLWGCVIALVGIVGLTLASHNYENKENTRLIFSLFLTCGIGALWHRSFLFLTPVMMAGFIAMKALSMRGIVAIFLSLLTPAILCLSIGIITPDQIIAEYSRPLTPVFMVENMWSQRVIIATSTAVIIACAIMFLPSYGYPAKQRTRNMAIIIAGLLTIVPPLLASEVATEFVPLLNVIIAYETAHFAATRDFGWIAVVISWLILTIICFV